MLDEASLSAVLSVAPLFAVDFTGLAGATRSIVLWYRSLIRIVLCLQSPERQLETNLEGYFFGMEKSVPEAFLKAERAALGATFVEGVEVGGVGVAAP